MTIAYRRGQDTVQYSENAQGFINLHEGRVYRELLCRMSGTLNIATDAALAVLEDAPYSIIRNLEVMVNGQVPLKTLSGKALLELTAKRMRVLPQFTAPGTATGDHTIEAYFTIPLWLPEGGLAMDSTLLDATVQGGVTSVTMSVDWGDAEDLVTPDATTVLSWTTEPSIEVISHDLTRNNSAANNYAIHRERTINANVTQTNDRFQVDLFSGRNRKAMSAMIIARDAGVRADDIVNKITIESDTETRYKMSSAINQDIFNAAHERATNRTGVYFVDLAPKGMLGHGHEMSDVSAFNLILDVTGGANHQLEVVLQEIIGGTADRIG